MGYTHYWTFGHFINEKQYKDALKAIRKIVKASPVPLVNWEGKRGTKPKVGADISFNGVEGGAHESFHMNKIPVPEADYGERPVFNPRFNFCKTACKPYDVVVVACLATLQHYLGNGVEVSSDGDERDWIEGCSFAATVLGERIPVPKKVRS